MLGSKFTGVFPTLTMEQIKSHEAFIFSLIVLFFRNWYNIYASMIQQPLICLAYCNSFVALYTCFDC